MRRALQSSFVKGRSFPEKASESGKRIAAAHKLFKKFVQRGHILLTHPPRACQDRLFSHVRYVETRSDAIMPLAGLDAPGARTLDKIRLLLLELLHHQGDGFLRALHRSNQTLPQLLKEFFLGGRGPDQDNRLARL